MTNREALRPQSSHGVWRRIGAVFAGLLLIVVLDTSIDVLMHATGVYPPWFQPMRTSLWLFAIAYRMVDGVAGSYLAARLAPDRPIAHALALGIVGVLLSTAGAIGTLNRGPEFGPRWYPIALIVIALPCAWVGGALRDRQLRA